MKSHCEWCQRPSKKPYVRDNKSFCGIDCMLAYYTQPEQKQSYCASCHKPVADSISQGSQVFCDIDCYTAYFLIPVEPSKSLYARVVAFFRSFFRSPQ